jgi:hypothetical protein
MSKCFHGRHIILYHTSKDCTSKHSRLVLVCLSLQASTPPPSVMFALFYLKIKTFSFV